jgi:hypothetical protein
LEILLKNQGGLVEIEPMLLRGLYSTRAAIKYLGGASTVFKRLRHAGWIAPINDNKGKRGGDLLFRRTDLDACIERMIHEMPPHLPSEIRRRKKAEKKIEGK